MIGRCAWCKRDGLPVVAVGHIEANSGPGGSINACRPCRDQYGLIPLEDHPDDSNGQPRFYSADARRS